MAAVFLLSVGLGLYVCVLLVRAVVRSPLLQLLYRFWILGETEGPKTRGQAKELAQAPNPSRDGIAKPPSIANDGIPPLAPSAAPIAQDTAPAGAPSLLDQLLAANPDSGLAHRLRGGPMPRTPPEFLEWIAREMGGQPVLAESRVAGHVTWLDRGRRFYYYERGLRSGTWTFVVTRVEEAVLPGFQMRAHRGPTPFVPLVRPWPDRLGVPRFDDGYELLVPVEVRSSEPPVSRDVVQAYLALERHVGRLHVLEASGHRCRLGILGVRPLRSMLRPLLIDAGFLLDAVVRPYAGHADTPAGFQLLDLLRCVENGAPHCGVCGEALDGPCMECARCGAPHHEDCWTYTGGCAIYACLGREGRRRDAARTAGAETTGTV